MISENLVLFLTEEQLNTSSWFSLKEEAGKDVMQLHHELFQRELCCRRSAGQVVKRSDLHAAVDLD